LSPKPIAFPVEGLTDGVVRLRLVTDADIPAIVEAVQDPEIPRYTRVPSPYGEHDARHWQRTATTGLAAGTDLAALVVDADDGRLLGAVGLHNLDPASGRCSAGYWVAAAERGRGVAGRALTLLCRYAFTELDAKRIELWIEPANAASLGVAETVGFHREGLLRSFMPIGETRRDMLMYSLLPQDLSEQVRDDRMAGPPRRPPQLPV
jgi:RimJ/RimL family protein N-acetyltransferase